MPLHYGAYNPDHAWQTRSSRTLGLYGTNLARPGKAGGRAVREVSALCCMPLGKQCIGRKHKNILYIRGRFGQTSCNHTPRGRNKTTWGRPYIEVVVRAAEAAKVAEVAR